MTMLTTRRLRALPGFVLVALGAFAATRAAPIEVLTPASAWDLRQGHRLESPATPPVVAMGSKRPVVLQRTPPRLTATNGFYESYLTPRMSALFGDENAFRATDATNPSSNPLMRDPADVELVGKRALRAVQGAFKRFAIERLGIDRWSLPGVGGSKRGGGVALADDSRRVRFHLGFSRLAPRADLLFPVTAGQVVLSADARGHLRTTFEPTSSSLRIAADLDVPERTATVRLSLQF